MQNRLQILLRLSKYQLSLTVSFSALTGYLLTGSSSLSVIFSLFTGVFLLACGSSALNQYQEREYDALMERTKKRPLPSGKIAAGTTLLICFLLIISGLFLLSLRGWISVSLGLLTLILYNFVYTPLKRVSSIAILPGALVGALCPLIGWTAGNLPIMHPIALAISTFVFLWQLPHFWLLLLENIQD